MFNFSSAKCVESDEEEKRTDNVVNSFSKYLKHTVNKKVLFSESARSDTTCQTNKKTFKNRNTFPC